MSAQDPVLPAATRRLFAPWDEAAVLAPEGETLLIGRLLEDGDRRDLRWLVARVGEAGLTRWFARRARRQLSRRSRAFWALLLDRPVAEGDEVSGGALWPL